MHDETNEFYYYIPRSPRNRAQLYAMSNRTTTGRKPGGPTNVSHRNAIVPIYLFARFAFVAPIPSEIFAFIARITGISNCVFACRVCISGALMRSGWRQTMPRICDK